MVIVGEIVEAESSHGPLDNYPEVHGPALSDHRIGPYI